MYGKFFASAFTGSMLGAGPDVFAVWGYVIANANGGQVELNPKLLGAMIGCDPERIEAAIEYLCKEDKNSRSPDEGGRRLVREGQFAYRVVNHALYLGIKNNDGLREYNRIAKRKSRERLKSTDVKRDVKACQGMSIQEEEEEVRRGNTPPTPSPLLLEAEPVGKAKRGDRDGELAEKLYQAYPRHEARLAAIPAIKRALKVKPYDQLMAATTAYAQAVSRWPAGNESFVCLPATWFNQGRYDDDPKGWERIAPTNGASRAGIQAALDRLIEETRFLPTGSERDGKLKEIEAMKGRLAQIP